MRAFVSSIVGAAAWVSAVCFSVLCLRQLARKVRAHEVVS